MEIDADAAVARAAAADLAALLETDDAVSDDGTRPPRAQRRAPRRSTAWTAHLLPPQLVSPLALPPIHHRWR